MLDLLISLFSVSKINTGCGFVSLSEPWLYFFLNYQTYLLLELRSLLPLLSLAGFSLGSTVQSHTKGIWMWCVPHPQKPDHTLVLLDTEGLGDVEKVSIENSVLGQAPDFWIFSTYFNFSSNKISHLIIICLFISAYVPWDQV